MKRTLVLGLVAALAALAACSKDKNPQPATSPTTEGKAIDPSSPAEAARVADKPMSREVPPQQPAAAGLGDAPDFTLKDLDGKEVTLSSFRGKTVVLEWFNPGCPFVKYAHGEGPLKDMARRAASEGVVWLAINSNAPGTQGNGVDVNRSAAKEWGMQHPVLIDEDGKVGKQYGATATPHMYVIDGQGKLVYRGALDNAPLGKIKGGGAAVNYVEAALQAVKAGKAPEVTETQAYGCSVKYEG